MQKLPAIAIDSIATSSLCFSRLWQFSTLHPMLDGRFVISFQENTIFVLDPINGVIVGVAVLKSTIKSVSASGGFVYILSDAVSKSIVRVALHHSFISMEIESKRQLQSNLSTPCTSANTSPIGSLESIFKGAERTTDSLQADKDVKESQVNCTSNESSTLAGQAKVSPSLAASLPTIHISEPVSEYAEQALQSTPSIEETSCPISKESDESELCLIMKYCGVYSGFTMIQISSQQIQIYFSSLWKKFLV